MTSSFWLWLTTAVMLVGGLAILFLGKRRTSTEELQTVTHGIVPIIAACSYFAMASGQGAILLPTINADTGGLATRVFYWARYIDWTFTTPLLLSSLAVTAMHSGRRHAGIFVGVILADLMMIATAFFFGLSEIAWLKWTWFLISCIAFLGVYYVIWVSQLEASRLEREDVRADYRRNAILLSVLWFLYPIILAISPDGLGVVSGTVGVFLIAVVDVTAKVVYGLMATMADTRATTRDLAETGSTTASIRRAA